MLGGFMSVGAIRSWRKRATIVFGAIAAICFVFCSLVGLAASPNLLLVLKPWAIAASVIGAWLAKSCVEDVICPKTSWSHHFIVWLTLFLGFSVFGTLSIPPSDRAWIVVTPFAFAVAALVGTCTWNEARKKLRRG